MLPRVIPTQTSDPILYPYRYGLVFGFFNALTWQVAINTPMVLFLQWLGATSWQVGLAYAFVFVLTPVQVLSTPLLPRFGYRRVMLSGWGLRTLFVAVPVVLAFFLPPNPEPGGWRVHVTVASVFFFCLLRAVGQSAFAPWIYALMPANASGRYFAADQYVSGIGGVFTLIGCTILFATLPVHEALLGSYLIALAGSIAAFFSLGRMPDGARPPAVKLRDVLHDAPRLLWRPSVFREYVILSVVLAVVMTPVPPFSAYYLKAVPRLSEGWIMSLEVCRYAGVIVAAGLMQTRLDRHGARRYLAGAAFIQMIVAVYWWLSLRWGVTSLVGLGAVYFLIGSAWTACIAANLNYLAKIATRAERTLMVTLHAAMFSCAGGVSAATWGHFLKRGASINVDAFQSFFVTCFVAALFAAWRISRLPESLEKPAEPLPWGSVILRPFRAIPFVGALVGSDRNANDASGKPSP